MDGGRGGGKQDAGAGVVQQRLAGLGAAVLGPSGDIDQQADVTPVARHTEGADQLPQPEHLQRSTSAGDCEGGGTDDLKHRRTDRRTIRPTTRCGGAQRGQARGALAAGGAAVSNEADDIVYMGESRKDPCEKSPTAAAELDS